MSTTEWNFTDAKSKLSEVLNRAEHDPQVIKRRDRRFIVVEDEEYQSRTGDLPSLKDVILNGPSLEGVDLERDQSPGRDFDL